MKRRHRPRLRRLACNQRKFINGGFLSRHFFVPCDIVPPLCRGRFLRIDIENHVEDTHIMVVRRFGIAGNCNSYLLKESEQHE